MSLRGLLLPLLLLIPSWADASASGGGVVLSEHAAADPAAPVVTAADILASERFWPYRVALSRPWTPIGRSSPLSADLPGVLIRVESSARARIDFGRDGVHEVPIGETDLIERAERIRRGELEKSAPNFVWAIGARLLDAASPVMAPVSLQRIAAQRGFLCVFADPRSDDFPALAQALAPLRERHGIGTILFPQGERPDEEVRERLRGLDWPVPFVHDHLSEGYTHSLVADATPAPHVLLQTSEGRALLERRWSAALAAELDGVIESSFAGAAAAHGGAAPGASPLAAH